MEEKPETQKDFPRAIELMSGGAGIHDMSGGGQSAGY